MVAKPRIVQMYAHEGLNLAKIHMVAKLVLPIICWSLGLNLAKIHMVAKPLSSYSRYFIRLNLAKIHMVAKLGLI